MLTYYKSDSIHNQEENVINREAFVESYGQTWISSLPAHSPSSVICHDILLHNADLSRPGSSPKFLPLLLKTAAVEFKTQDCKYGMISFQPLIVVAIFETEFSYVALTVLEPAMLVGWLVTHKDLPDSASEIQYLYNQSQFPRFFLNA